MKHAAKRRSKCKREYSFSAIVGARIGGLHVLIATKALAKIFSRMMSEMMS
jgi:hypothetical protein